MITVNLSPDRERYFSQRNNVIAPGVTCKPTATVEALRLAGWPLPSGELAQPEDNLTAWCRSRDGYKALARLSPTNAMALPNEDWKVIAFAVNQVFLPADKPVLGPRWDWDLREALAGLVHGLPMACSTWLTKAGHVVDLVGFEYDDKVVPAVWQNLDLSRVAGILVDDPYGNSRAEGGYAAGDLNGWNNRFTLGEWLKVWRGTGIQVRPKVE